MAVDPESESDLDEGELEAEVREMAKKIAEYRKTLPDHLRNTLHSAFSSSHRPDIASGSDPQPSCLTIAAETQAPLMLGTGENQDCEQKMIQLKETLSRNAENIPKVVKRVREAIHKLDSLDRTTIHPAFKRRRFN